MTEEQPPTEIVTLHSAGPIPGIPGGSRGAGRYLVDWIERTATPVIDAAESVVEHVEEAVHPEEPAPTPDAPAEAAPPEQSGEPAPVEEQSAN